MKNFLIFLVLVMPVMASAQPLWSENGNGVQLENDLLSQIIDKGSGQFSVTADTRQFQVQVQKVEKPNLGVTSVRGLVDNNPDSFFLLCRTESGAAVAFFQPGDGTAYRLDHTEGGEKVYQVEYGTMGSCGGAIKAESLRPNGDSNSPKPRVTPEGLISAADDGSVHDILIGYTPAAELVMGGWDFIRAEAQLAVDAANLAYVNSNINSFLRLVHVMSTDYSENTAWSYDEHLNFLYYPADGNMDAVLTMRETVGADFVSMLIDGRDFSGNVPTCGIAPVMQSDNHNAGFEDAALSVVSVQCATTNWSLAHEVGHNRGCAHDRDNSTIAGVYSYSYGRQISGSNNNDYRSVMAYDNENEDFPRVPYFTNPNISLNGVPTTIPPRFAPSSGKNAHLWNLAGRVWAPMVSFCFHFLLWRKGSSVQGKVAPL